MVEGAGYVQLCLDALSRRDRQHTLRHTGRETCESRTRAGHLAFRISKEALVLIEGNESCENTNCILTTKYIFFFFSCLVCEGEQDTYVCQL